MCKNDAASLLKNSRLAASFFGKKGPTIFVQPVE